MKRINVIYAIIVLLVLTASASGYISGGLDVGLAVFSLAGLLGLVFGGIATGSELGTEWEIDALKLRCDRLEEKAGIRRIGAPK